MDPITYKFDLGAFECVAVSDGRFAYAPPLFPPPAQLLFTHAAPDRLYELLREAGTDLEGWTEWTSQYTCLLVRTGTHVVLVDTGAGRLGPGTGRMLDNLVMEGIRPEDIDTIILTHAHPDHLGGNTDGQGNPAFPRARWVMSRTEWEYWMEGTTGAAVEATTDVRTEAAEATGLEEPSETMIEIARHHLLPLVDVLDLALREEEIVPGIRVVPTPGHTPGHLAVALRSGDDRLLCLGDLFLHPVHVRQPAWSGVVDAFPDVLLQTRKRVLAEAAADRSLLMAFHFPFPGLGRVTESDGAWRWEPATG